MSVQAALRWRLSLFAFMFITGLGIASWVTRTPDVRDAIGASTAEMGLVLFGISTGSMLGITGSGRLVRRLGTRPVIATATALVTVGVATIAWSSADGFATGVFLGLLLFGLGGGVGEIGLNIDGADVERHLGRPVLPALHGCFSLGTLFGSAVGILMTAVHFPVAWHLTASAATMTGLGLWAYRSLPTGRPDGAARREDNAPGHSQAPRAAGSVWRDRTLLLLGAALLALALAEGAANDWLPLITVDGLHLAATQGSLMFAAFAAVMTIGRFSGHALIARIGKQGVLLGSALTAGTGVALVSLVAAPWVVVVGVALWGLGASLGFPVAISVAGDHPDRPAERVSAVATAGYVAFLVGPPALGFLGQHYGLRMALLLVVVLLVVAVVALVARARAGADPAPLGRRRGSLRP